MPGVRHKSENNPVDGLAACSSWDTALFQFTFKIIPGRQGGGDISVRSGYIKEPTTQPDALFTRRLILAICLFTAILMMAAGRAYGEETPARSMDAVFHPDAFAPFAMTPNINGAQFERLWRENPAWILANLSHAAYHPGKTVSELMTRCGAKVCHVYDQNGASAFLAIWSDMAILSFRGTQAQSTEDLAADFLFLPAPYGSSTVHTGFLMEINKIWPQIESDLKKEISQKSPPIPVWATGHSLGGALATLAGMRYEFQAVVTFGEPPVGRDIEKMFKSKRHLRYVNGEDPVSNLPEIFSNYFGEPLQLNNADGLSDWRYDHAIGYYAENLFRKP
jgi:hypothetical protein